jgi:hypothetical protein
MRQILIFTINLVGFLSPSDVYFTKVNRQTPGAGIDFGDHWNQIVEQCREETKHTELDVSENSTYSNEGDSAVDDFYVKMSKSLEMYCPDKVTQSLRICVNLANQNWSEPFILRFKESSSLIINENKVDESSGTQPNDGKAVGLVHIENSEKLFKEKASILSLCGST